jgi:hypothetical protein
MPPRRVPFTVIATTVKRETGGPYAMEIYIAQKALKMIGPRVSFAVIGDSGKEVRRIRCAQCGSPLVTEFDVLRSFNQGIHALVRPRAPRDTR